MPKRPLRLLIPNVTGPTNMGDQAILGGTLRLLRKIYPDVHITLHSSDVELYKTYQLDFPADVIDHTLYHWAVFARPNFITRIWRLFLLGIYYLRLSFGFLRPKEKLERGTLGAIARDYCSADIIVWAGGGYLRSSRGFTESLNFLMHIFMLAYGACAGARKKIVAPMSFGPFAKRWQKCLAARVLKSFDWVSIREAYSFEMLKKEGLENLLLANDFAFFNPPALAGVSNGQKPRLGFTIRNWFLPEAQKKFEENFAMALVSFSRSFGAEIVPIVQVDAPRHKSADDVGAIQRIVERLKKSGVVCSAAKKSYRLDDYISFFGKIDLLLGMRMHSNILAASAGAPFVAISYEHKTEGIAEMLDMSQFVVLANDFTAKSAVQKLTEIFARRAELGNKLRGRIKAIRIAEEVQWQKILSVD